MAIYQRDEMRGGRFIFGGILILLGISIFTGLDVFRFVIPAILIWLGYKIITKKDGSMRDDHDHQSLTSSDLIDEVIVLNSLNKKVNSQDFEGGKLTVVLAGAELDLSDVKVKSKEVKLDLTAVLGGIRVKVPDNWSVTDRGTTILGGVDIKTSSAKNGVNLTISGVAILGGIEIYN